MPPRGQLDQISEAIGELKGSVKSIEKYIHEERHGLRNLSQKVDAIGTLITREIAAVEARIDVQIEAMNARLAAVETAQARQAGERGLLVAFLKSPVVGWLVGAGVTLWLLLSGKGAH